MNSNDYGYGGQKRPLEDGGTHSFLLHLFLWSMATVPERLQVVFLFVDSVFFFHSRELKHFVPLIDVIYFFISSLVRKLKTIVL